MCKVYDCDNNTLCILHNQDNITTCQNINCNNCYIINGLNYCESCRSNGNKSKNKIRNLLKEFKIKLGGECTECKMTELFVLEFNHIDPSKKINQITRSRPSVWELEIDNLELLCGRCHRIKTNDDLTEPIVETKNNICKKDKKEFVREIKKSIGKCQICEWTHIDKDKMCCALDFDHISGEKYKQISRLYTTKKETIAKEIAKTRLICRHCHELYTCLQRGQKALDFYYTKEKIENLKNKLLNENLKIQSQKEIHNILLEKGFLNFFLEKNEFKDNVIYQV